ncbi:hypothetical protein MKZ38_003309 [Zalerion maritima]|uniref:Uncharacterized protein n=1 Tax=Zalerion maritima TaxID=339359 RepID=A0AAD5RPE3_9PEZI|nr:hypothetical protein MKZ38_003309 [Zalerion maritima]
MKATTTLQAAINGLFLLASISTSAPLSRRAGKMDPGLFTWNATDWVVGCSPAACGWGFNVTAPAGYIADAPEFQMTCGALYGAGWRDCRTTDGTDFELPAGSNVQAYWPPPAENETQADDDDDDAYVVRLAHVWYDADATAYWNATGEAIATTQTQSFGITGKLVEAAVQGYKP